MKSGIKQKLSGINYFPVLIIVFSLLVFSCNSSGTGGDEETDDIYIPVEGITLVTSTTASAGSTVQLDAEINPADASDKSVTWSTDDDTIAEVSNTGLVTAKTAGDVVITVTSDDDNTISAQCIVTVTAAPVPVTGITLGGTPALCAGSTKILAVTITPADATNQDVTWSSDNETVATVSENGLITANAAGTVRITAVSDSDNSITATREIRVVVPTTYTLASQRGEYVKVSAGTVDFGMIYANNSTNITIPTTIQGIGVIDTGTATLTQRFFIGETAVTNELMAVVLNWAKNKNYISETASAHNGVSAASVKYGGKILVKFSTLCKISYDTTSKTFSVKPGGFENHPVIDVTWYGSIMFCNWLTEMQNNSTANVVYSGIPATYGWTHTSTIDNVSRKGYRLPLNDEWEFAARYCGTATGGRTDLVSRGVNSGSSLLTPGYYWTSGNYASGALADITNFSACDEVAWFSGNTTVIMPVAWKKPNQLGLYDASGNANEWCFSGNNLDRNVRSDCVQTSLNGLALGNVGWSYPDELGYLGDRGLRLCKYK